MKKLFIVAAALAAPFLVGPSAAKDQPRTVYTNTVWVTTPEMSVNFDHCFGEIHAIRFGTTTDAVLSCGVREAYPEGEPEPRHPDGGTFAWEGRLRLESPSGGGSRTSPSWRVEQSFQCQLQGLSTTTDGTWHYDVYCLSFLSE